VVREVIALGGSCKVSCKRDTSTGRSLVAIDRVP